MNVRKVTNNLTGVNSYDLLPDASRPVLDCWIPYSKKSKVPPGRHLATYKVIRDDREQICVGFLWWETRTIGNYISTSRPKTKTGWFTLNGGFGMEVLAWCRTPAPYEPR